MAGMMEEVTDGGSSCRIHIFRRVPRAAATCLISARVELPSLHPPPHGLPLAAAAARPGPATSTTPCSFPTSHDIKAQGRVGRLSFQWRRQTSAPCQRTATPLLVVFRRLSGGDQAAHARTCDSNFSLTFVRPFSTATREMNRGFWAGLRSRKSRLSSAIRLCGCPCGGSCGGPPTTRETKFPHFMAMCDGRGSS